MIPRLIESVEEYKSLISNYNQKNCISNDYLQNNASQLISEGLLSAVAGNENLFLFVRKEGFLRLYYYINNLLESSPIPDCIISTEVIFRSANGLNQDEITYLEKLGFKKNLQRDQYSGVYGKLNLPELHNSVIVRPANSIKEIEKAVNLFNSVFDRYTGDFIPPHEYENLLQSKDIYIALSDDVFVGALHRSFVGSTAWISHIAVDEYARGKKVAKSLVNYFINDNKTTDKTRYMLWVQCLNVPALKLYSNFGFVPTGKSSLSMVKL